MKRLFCTLALSILLLPAATFAASKEQQEMQRDIAQLQDQVRTIQSTLDQSLAALQTLIEQSLEAGNRTSTNLSVLGASVKDMLDRELRMRCGRSQGSPQRWITSTTIRLRCGAR